MITFLPYADFRMSAKVLDRARLGKQRVEANQLTQIIGFCNSNSRWWDHPCTRMWFPYKRALEMYKACIIEEWIGRGYKNNIKFWPSVRFTPHTTPMPPWLGDEALHASHRANLLRKKPEHYSQFGWKEAPMEGYVWPVPPVY